MTKNPINQQAYNTLSYYTLSLKDAYFIHQHIVDAYTAQTADKNTKPIAITFALAGLYLFLEKGFSGKRVQNMHMKMAKFKRAWPNFNLPQSRGEVTVTDVLSVLEGAERDRAIRKWCESVWEAYKDSHKQIEDLLKTFLV